MQITAEAVCLSPKRDHGEIVLVDTNGHGALTLRGSDDEIHELLSLIADLLYENGAEVSKRDPGRDDIDSGNVWPAIVPTDEARERWFGWQDRPLSEGIDVPDVILRTIRDQVREGGRKLGAS